MAMCSSSPPPVSLLARPLRCGRSMRFPATARFRAASDVPVPDFLSSDWLESRKKRPFGPRLDVMLTVQKSAQIAINRFQNDTSSVIKSFSLMQKKQFSASLMR